MSWVTAELGARLVDGGGAQRLDELVTLALRRNPRRAHLLVSHVLGKHVPAPPAVVLAAGKRLAETTCRLLADAPVAYVLGYAETATALGHIVAATLDAPYLHSTRRPVPGAVETGRFEEEHSHATAHRLLADDAALLTRDGVVVLVDDELSTGRTAVNTVVALQRLCPRNRYVVACLVDLRSDELGVAGTRIEVAALARGRLELPDGFALRAGEIAGGVGTVDEPPPAGPAREVQLIEAWPDGVREGGRHGFSPADDRAARAAARSAARALVGGVRGPRVLVLGCEELMYAPLLIADAMQSELGPRHEVRFSSTTRSPIVAVDAPGYPVRTGLAFPAHDGPDDVPRYAYNVAPSAHDAADSGFDDIVVVVDDVADTDDLRTGLLAQVSAVCKRLHLLVLPAAQPAVVTVAAR